jgi:hypothetical protein
VKAYESYASSDSELEPKKGRRIIDVEPSATIATTKLQPGEPDEPEEGEHLFHSQIWVKGTLLHFIIDRSSQKNLTLAEVVKQMALPTTPHPQPYTIGWLHQGSDLHVSHDFLMASIPSKMRYCVMFLLSIFVIFFWANIIYGNVMLYMSLGLVVLLLL